MDTKIVIGSTTQHHLRRDVLYLASATIIIVLSEWLGLLQPVRAISESMIEPAVVRTAQLQWLVARPITLIGDSWNAASRVQDLEQRYSEALVRINQLQALETENQALRELLAAQPRPEGVYVATPVISYGVPGISVGEKDGIGVGMLVLAQGTLVGRISEISPYQSRVRLVTERGSTPMLARTSAGVEGLIVGDGKRVLLTEVAPDAVVQVGDTVVTVGELGAVANVLVGRIHYSISTQTAPTQTFVIEQSVSLYEVPIVTVVQQ